MLINDESPELNYKRQLVKHFDRASLSYDSYAEFQRIVLKRLLSLLPTDYLLSTKSCERVLDLGSGTGQALPSLMEQLQPRFCFSLDLSCQMLSVAQQNFSHLNNVCYLCADGEFLPFSKGSLDVVFSSLAIQWSLQSEVLFAGLFDSLKPGGFAVFSTLLKGSMPEIEKAWSTLDGRDHIHHYVSLDTLSSQLLGAGFDITSLSEETITMQFDTPDKAIYSLKKVGASLIRTGVNSTVSPRTWKAFIGEYEKQRDDLGVPLSYQVAFVVVHKPY